HAVRVADAAQAAEPARRRNDDAGLALDRLDQHRPRSWRDRALDRGGTAERNRAGARRERAETLPIVGPRRSRGGRRGAAVEIAGGDDDFGAVAGDALDAAAPAARGLDGGLDRLRAGVHRQCGVERGELAQLLEKRAEAVAVIGARGYGEALGLRRQRRP